VDAVQIQRLKRNEAVFERIVQMAINSGSVVVAMFQGRTSGYGSCEALLY